MVPSPQEMEETLSCQVEKDPTEGAPGLSEVSVCRRSPHKESTPVIETPARTKIVQFVSGLFPLLFSSLFVCHSTYLLGQTSKTEGLAQDVVDDRPRIGI